MRSNFGIILSLLLAGTTVFSCKKNKDNPGDFQLSYGDSIIYLKNQASDYIVRPVQSRAGEYTAFPEGIEIDKNDGTINVSKSETGLRYRIKYTAPNGDTSVIKVLLSGIHFADKFYHLSQNDSVAFPIYNGKISNTVPVSGSSFDDDNSASTGGCAIYTNNGQINLAQTIRNGVFGTIPQNDAKIEFEIKYRLNDQSNKSLNKLKVKLYYYQTINDVPQDLLDLLQQRQEEGVFLDSNPGSFSFTGPLTARTGNTAGFARPRPPCVIIIDH